MKSENIVIQKSFDLALSIVRFTKVLQQEQKEFILSKQIMRSGTSVGANVREAHNAESKKDFIHKLAIAQKECDETKYWLELLKEAGYLNKEEFENLYKQASETLKIIRSIILTTKQNMRNER